MKIDEWIENRKEDIKICKEKIEFNEKYIKIFEDLKKQIQF